MSILHYFSKDANRRARFIFNTIAPIYGKADGYLQNNYSESIKLLNSEIGLTGKSVLDVGTGTGSWAAMFETYKASKVHGIDLAEKMLIQSRKNHPQIDFSIGDAENLDNIKDNSFDIVTASYLLHGVKTHRRIKILSEMKRVSKQFVIIHDFIGETPLIIRFLEFMEKSDYKNFKSNFIQEMNTLFSETKCINSDQGSGLYIGIK